MSVWKIMVDAGRIRLLILLHARYFYVFCLFPVMRSLHVFVWDLMVLCYGVLLIK